MLQNIILNLIVFLSFPLFAMNTNHMVLYKAFGITLNQQNMDNIPLEVQKIIASNINEENEQSNKKNPLEQAMFKQLIHLYFHNKPNEETLKTIEDSKQIIHLAEQYFKIPSFQLLQSFNAFDAPTKESIKNFIDSSLPKPTYNNFDGDIFPSSGNIPMSTALSPHPYDKIHYPYFPSP